MADRVSASISIGGVLSASAYAELIEIIACEGLAIEWDGEPFEPHHHVAGEPLCLFAHEVAGGSFDELESWCLSRRVVFVRWCGDAYASLTSAHAACAPAGPRSL